MIRQEGETPGLPFSFREPPVGREFSSVEKEEALNLVSSHVTLREELERRKAQFISQKTLNEYGRRLRESGLKIRNLILKAEVNNLFPGILGPREKIVLALREGNYLYAKGYYKEIVDWAIEQGRLSLPGERLSLKEIGQVFGLSDERIRQINQRAWGKLGNAEELRRFREYLEGKLKEPESREEGSLDLLGLSPRPYHALRKAGISQISQFLRPDLTLDLERLAQVRNFGLKCLQELGEKLAAHDPSFNLEDHEARIKKMGWRWKRWVF